VRKRRSLVDVIITADAAVVVTITAPVFVLEEAVVAAGAPRGDGVGGAAPFLLLPLELGDAGSISGVKLLLLLLLLLQLRDWMRAYNWVVKSLKSMLSASPGIQG
jgi:hypothetical protein